MEKKDFSKMEAVVNRYVKAYREDFAIDKDILESSDRKSLFMACTALWDQFDSYVCCSTQRCSGTLSGVT